MVCVCVCLCVCVCVCMCVCVCVCVCVTVYTATAECIGCLCVPMCCTAGVWSCPATTGERPPPCAYFTFTAVDDRRAVLVGGYNGDQGRMNDVYIIDLPTMVNG